MDEEITSAQSLSVGEVTKQSGLSVSTERIAHATALGWKPAGMSSCLFSSDTPAHPDHTKSCSKCRHREGHKAHT